jgi:hypothetical protein
MYLYECCEVIEIKDSQILTVLATFFFHKTSVCETNRLIKREN